MPQPSRCSKAGHPELAQLGFNEFLELPQGLRAARPIPEGRRSPGINTPAEAALPSQPNQVSIVRIVIGVVMGQENVPHAGQRYIGKDKLPCNTVAAIYDVGRVVGDNDLRGSRPGFLWSGAATGSEENQPGLPARALPDGEQWGACYRNRTRQKCASA